MEINCKWTLDIQIFLVSAMYACLTSPPQGWHAILRRLSSLQMLLQWMLYPRLVTFQSYLIIVYSYIHPSNFMFVSRSICGHVQVRRDTAWPQPKCRPLIFIGHGARTAPFCLLSFLQCRSDNPRATIHSVPCTSFPFQLIPVAQEEVVALNRSSSPAIPSRDAPAGRPVERRMATADPSSPARCMPRIPRCASTSCLSPIHPPSSAVPAAVELPIWLFPNEEPRHPSREKWARQASSERHQGPKGAV